MVQRFYFNHSLPGFRLDHWPNKINLIFFFILQGGNSYQIGPINSATQFILNVIDESSMM